MKFRLIESSRKIQKHFDKLKPNTKYKLLTPKEAGQKAFVSRGDALVVFGYPKYMYNCIKGDLPYVMLELSMSEKRWQVVGKRLYSISVDMVEPYAKVIKYNKDKL